MDCKKYLSVRGRSEYKTWNKKVKELMDVSKMRVGEEFDRQLSENLQIAENWPRKLFWKEVKKEREAIEGVGLRMKRDFGMLVSSKKKVKGVWKSRVVSLMNGEEALVTSMGIEA